MKIWKYYLKENKNYYPKTFYLLKDRFDEIRTQIVKFVKGRKNYTDNNKFQKNINDFVWNLTKNSTSSGSFRKVIFLDKDFIMKFAINKSGLHQNEQEVYLFSNTKYSNFFPKIYEVDKQFFWILGERAQEIFYFDDIPLDNLLIHKMNLYSVYVSKQEMWQMMNWGLAEILKHGEFSFQNFEKFYDFIIFEEGNSASASAENWGKQRFIFFLETDIYKAHGSPEISDEKDSFDKLIKRAKTEPEIHKMMKNSLYSLFNNYLSGVKRCNFTKSIINLAIEIPNMEIWDIRPGNLGFRKDTNEVLILDSSLDMSGNKE